MKKTLIAALLGLMVSPLALADNAPATQTATPATTTAPVVVKKAADHKAAAKPAAHKKHKVSTESHKLVSEVQSQLHRLGYKIGKVDGYNGKKTRAAVRKFQKDHHHKVTGKITHQLLAQLKAAK
ncbi:peptidoglycan-binding domain-containing protein [Celerinatantimonas sp. MCCC 1A17872]|uniref:peptidoglycan-binding domain-containing protein n=1 Tax=Celerinatantimonas sp. MCCC 1A17872 TaxID=3177514 RepID=UPI0038BF0072